MTDWPVEGILSHTAGPTDDGWRVVDVWKSEEAFRAFGEVLVPILQEVGLGGEPQVFAVHNFVEWRRATPGDQPAGCGASSR